MPYFTSHQSTRVTAPDNPERRVTLGNAIDWARAEASLALQGPVDPERFDARKAACLSCPELATNTEPKDEIGFCKACGCGTGARAALSVKLTMPEAKCPKNLWT